MLRSFATILVILTILSAPVRAADDCVSGETVTVDAKIDDVSQDFEIWSIDLARGATCEVETIFLLNYARPPTACKPGATVTATGPLELDGVSSAVSVPTVTCK